jgi:DNA-binding transcriptional ArsR family regulator
VETVELAFSTADLARTRFVVSPMWQVVTSFKLLARGGDDVVHRPWMEQVRPRVAAAGLDGGWLAELIPGSRGYLADFLNPTPAEAAPSLAAELAAIRSTPADEVRADLEKLGSSPRLRALAADPTARLARVAEEIELYWELALAPYWARIQAVLDADIFHRARQVAEHGPGHLFNDLHSTVTWDDSTLRLVKRQCAMASWGEVNGLFLVPLAFWTGVMTRSVLPDPPQLAYPGRGVGTLWERRPAARSEAVAAVIGRSRARLLTELDAPASTSELAGRTGISAAGVSQHLTALRDAGMVSAHRAGRSVLYARTAVAESLLCASD